MSLLLIDSHVHIHKMYNINTFFDSVYNNFSFYSKSIDNEKKWNGVLLLTEMKNVNQFGKLSNLNSVGENNKYKIEKTSENISLKITSPEGNTIYVIAGKQIIAEEKIEVLALCTNKDFEEHQSLSSTINRINEVGGIAVLPWGVGKWSGKRKEILEKFIEEYKDEKFWLGDNSGRPYFWPEPSLFKIGNQSGHFVLPGTDALAIPNQIKKTGTYGFYLYNEIDDNFPAKTLKKIITELKAPPKYFGSLEKVIPFFKNQITMQLNKRK